MDTMMPNEPRAARRLALEQVLKLAEAAREEARADDPISNEALYQRLVAPRKLAALLAPFLEAVLKSDLSLSDQQAIKTQVELLRKEAEKPSDKRDKNVVQTAIETIKTLASGASAVKAV